MPSVLTAEELLHLSIPDKRVELVRGVLVVREPAGGRHGRIALNVAVELRNYVSATARAGLYAGEPGFTRPRPPDTVRAPDVAFVHRDRLPSPEPIGFPDLAP